MKHLKHLFTAMLLLCTTFATAHEFEIDGIFYNIYSETNKTVEVTYKGGSYSVYSHEYYGTIVIPKTISYNGTIYSVARIGSDAFRDCSDLTSIEIPNSVTSIGESAFSGCDYLTSVTIPNSVTSIGYRAFLLCYCLTSVHISDLSAWCNIEFDNVLANPLCYAKNLYLNGELLTNLIIPNGVTKIKNDAFYGCTALTSITIPNSVTSIGEEAFCWCDGLTSVTIGNGVTSIGNYAFCCCAGLTSIEIPNSVTSIGSDAFSNCVGLKEIYVKAKTPATVTSNTFEGLYDTATLYVPTGTKAAYQVADGWKDFANIVEIKQVEPVTEVTINVDESGYATYCSEYALDFSEIEDVKVYAATGYNSDTQVVTLARVMTTAAEIGIFIKGEPGEYVVPVIDECSEHSLNLFVGTSVETTVNSTSGGKYNFNFKVNNDDSAPMFYPFEDSTIFGANKAYLQIPSEWLDTNASKSISIMFDDEEANGLKGDINGDGRVSVTDIQSVVNIILNVE